MMMVMMVIKEDHYGDVDGNSDDYEYGNNDGDDNSDDYDYGNDDGDDD